MKRPSHPPSPIRAWVGPVVAVVASITLLVLPKDVRRSIAMGLEHSIFSPYRYTVGWGEGTLAARREIRRLAQIGTEERVRGDRILETLEENRRLRRLLGFRRRTAERLLPAAVVGRDRGRDGDLVIAEVEAASPVPDGAPVLVPEGLLGRVVQSDGRRVRVQCLTNSETSVSVLNQRTRDEGILRGSLERRTLLVVLDVPVQADWRLGDRVVTSGLGTIFPRGLLVGTVVGMRREEMGPLERVWVEPAASPARAEEIFMLLPGGEEPAEDIEWFPSDPEPPLSILEWDDGRGLTFGPLPAP